jgi:hypothetical protein
MKKPSKKSKIFEKIFVEPMTKEDAMEHDKAVFEFGIDDRKFEAELIAEAERKMPEVYDMLKEFENRDSWRFPQVEMESRLGLFHRIRDIIIDKLLEEDIIEIYPIDGIGARYYRMTGKPLNNARRSEVLHIGLTPYQLQKLHKKAEKAEITVDEFIITRLDLNK